MADITVVQFPGTKVAGLEYQGPLAGIADVWNRMGPLAGAAGLFQPNRLGMTLVKKSPMEPPAGEIHMVACVQIDDTISVPEEFIIEQVPAGDYALYIHEGSYANLANGWQTAMGTAEAATGRKLANRPCFEIYANNPQTTPEADLRTEIYLPVD